MAQAFLAVTHMSHTSSAVLLQPEPEATLQYTRQGNLHIIQSDSSGLEYLAGSERGVGGGGLWHEHIDGELRIALFVLRWSKIT